MHEVCWLKAGRMQGAGSDVGGMIVCKGGLAGGHVSARVRSEGLKHVAVKLRAEAALSNWARAGKWGAIGIMWYQRGCCYLSAGAWRGSLVTAGVVLDAQRAAIGTLDPDFGGLLDIKEVPPDVQIALAAARVRTVSQFAVLADDRGGIRDFCRRTLGIDPAAVAAVVDAWAQQARGHSAEDEV